MRRILTGLCLATVAFLANAQAYGDACQGDVRQFCSGSNGATARKCLLDHQKDISDGCYDDLKQRLANADGGRSDTGPGSSYGPRGGSGGGNGGGNGAGACKRDAETLCANISPGGGRIVQCLKDHAQELSDGCYDTLKDMKERGRRRR